MHCHSIIIIKRLLTLRVEDPVSTLNLEIIILTIVIGSLIYYNHARPHFDFEFKYCHIITAEHISMMIVKRMIMLISIGTSEM